VERLELAPLLDGWLEAALEAWPELRHGLDDPLPFLAHLAKRLPLDGNPPDRMWPDDLYLAHCCVRGEREALAILEERYLSEIEDTLTRTRFSPTLAQEVKSIVRDQLLVPGEGKQPLLVKYSGRGPLRSWLRVIAVRTAWRVLQQENRESPFEERTLLDSPLVALDPESRYLKQLHGDDVNVALRDAIRRLSTRQRLILRYFYVERVGLDEIARIYGVHKVTVSRWLSRSRELILSHVRHALIQKLDLSPSECESVIRLCVSQLDFSLRTVLSLEDAS
jgi:RNA polymerase sigma-70 factor (ECF subfamily)